LLNNKDLVAEKVQNLSKSLSYLNKINEYVVRTGSIGAINRGTAGE
jgi:hypothetical protein